MKKRRVGKLIVYTAVLLLFVLGALIANNLLERENILDRISQLPDLEVKTLDEETFSTRDLNGENPALLIYFNTECIFCGQMFEEILTDGQLQQYVRLVFVSDEPPETVVEYRKKTGMDLTNEFVFLYDYDRQVRDFYGIRSVPATYLYTEKGELIRYYRGQVSVDELIGQLQDVRE